ncbi:MAG TPA: chorismate mutase [Saprospiraceae bacterium]|nr:chorismate mutase [Saprospiraceae bacterium]HQW56747.1 chorismate mutase [Saprospiraceae bacterium]
MTLKTAIHSTPQTSLTALLARRPLIISGPCSAETEEQLLRTAHELVTAGSVDVFRAGIWKPRTRPGSFEGIGKEALSWLRTIKAETGLPVSVEVANARQVNEAIEGGVDILWLGARTTVNPFSVQEVADALKDHQIPVFVKNPLNPDIDLWTGAVERVQNAGIEWVGLIHRGFSAYGTTLYRNAPMWHLAIEMKRRHINLPMINDPSHICGNRHMIPETLQYAADLGYDGVMIESHFDPDQAWSDSNQQLTPQDLKTILGQIIWRQKKLPLKHEALIEYREQIDQLDDEILSLMGKRMVLSEKIGIYKGRNNISILQLKRWADILERAFKKGRKMNLSDDFIKGYLSTIHLESIRKQEEQMNRESKRNDPE